MIPAYPPLPIAFPRDPLYIAAAGVLRAARAEWFAACAEPIHSLDVWRARVDSRNRAYQEALLVVRHEEDRILAARAAERADRLVTVGEAFRTGGQRFGRRAS